MGKLLKKYNNSVYAFILTIAILGMVQWKVERPILMAERFIHGAGWIELILAGIYAGWITHKILKVKESARWRRISWMIFTIVFFVQLGMGLAGYEKFLMTGELHLPVPVMIMGGPIFRGEISFMPILFLSTVLISGPAWCSQLCYFGALDNLSARRRAEMKPIRQKFRTKHLFLLAIILTILLLRALGIDTRITTALVLAFGITGIGIILSVSKKKGEMIHCILWCPIGTLVNYLKLISPFRMFIDSSCTDCMACTGSCNYDALSPRDISERKPGLTCTYCGDCLASCNSSSIKYRLGSMTGRQARNAWIILTISLHAIFLALARI